MNDIREIKQQTNIVDVISRYVHLTKRGSEYYGICPFHDDSKESLQVNERKQIFKCFACGAGSDALDFLTKYGRTFKEAIQELKDPYNTGGVQLAPEQRQAYKPKPRVEWKDATPTEPVAEIRHWQHGIPSKTWAYHNEAGTVIGYACRFDLPSGKMVLPFTFKTDGSRTEWRWQGFDKPRPLYNLHLLKQNPDKTVLLVEGEKTADAASRLISTAIVTTWMGGADGIRTADLRPLFGRKIVLWPDNDYSHAYGDKHPLSGQTKPFHEQPGNKAMLAFAELLRPHCSVIKWVRNPDGTPCGWDIADSDWTADQATAYVRSNLIPVPETPKEPEAEPEPEPLPTISPNEMINDLPSEVPPADFPEDLEDEPDHKGNEYFRLLGYEKAETGQHAYYFYAYNPKTVVRLAPSAMTKTNLMQLAPINWWETEFPGSKGGVHIDAAQNWLIQRSHEIGIFNEKWVRGRGAWIDGNKVVIHGGNHLIVDGKPFHLSKFDSKFIYEIGEEMGFDTDNPLTNREASKLIEVLQLLNWEREINAYLLAGWCVVAPVCGALNWRPHIWLTGAAGTGKSWVFKHLVRRLLGETALAVQGETSEAGLRQTLKQDALPVVFDEAEGEDKKAQDRMQDVLSLMRAASAFDGGIMAKGTAGGMAKTYRIRSCFAFASIAVQIVQQSDRTRVSVLGLVKADDAVKAERWKALQAAYNNIITDEFCARLRARTIGMLPTILKNAATFSNAAAAVLGEQRTGDQVGTLLAGAYSLTSSKEISYEDAVKWVQEKDWSEEKAQEATRDEFSLITHIMEQPVRVETGMIGILEQTVGELVMNACKWKPSTVITHEVAQERLNRIGIKTENDYVYISNSSDQIKKMLANTAWSRNHNKILMRLNGAQAVDSTRFASGVRTRAVKIPLDTVFT